MRFKFLAGPKTGQVIDVIPNGNLAIFEGAGIIERVPEAAPPPAKLTWNLCRTLITKEWHIGITCSCGETVRIPRPTANATWMHCGVRERIPADVLEQYQRATKDAKPAPSVQAQIASAMRTELGQKP